MRRLLKWIGIGLGVLIGLLLVAGVALYLTGTSRLTQTYDVEAETITIPTDETALARGGYLAVTVCAECHQSNFAGSTPDNIFVDEPGIITLYAANLTPGKGGISDLSDADLIRAIRHGLDQDGTPLIVMPAEIFSRWSAEDLGAVIAFVRTLAPVDNEVPEPQVGPLARIVYPLGMTGQIIPATYIDHNRPFPKMPEITVSEDYGHYLVSAMGCTLCHGDNLAGGRETIQLPPGSGPLSANLTGDHLAGWTADDFIETIRSGVTPDGHEIDAMAMPIDIYSRMSDEDLQALWLYIQSVAAAASVAE